MTERLREPCSQSQLPESLLPLRQAWEAVEAGTEQPAGYASHDNYLHRNVQYTKALSVYNWGVAISQDDK